MKKNISLSLIIGLSQLFFSCTKEKSTALTTSSLNKTDTAKVASAKVDSAKVSGNKQLLAVGCKHPSNVQVAPYPVGYTVVGEFSSLGGISLPKGNTWSSGTFTLNFQPDGNLVIYNGSGQPIWDCPQAWQHNPTFVLQPDMNFVAYANNNPNTPVWSSGTQDFYCNGRIPSGTRLILTATGDLEVIADGVNSYGIRVTCVLASTLSSQGKKTGTGEMTKFATTDNPYGVGFYYGI